MKKLSILLITILFLLIGCNAKDVTLKGEVNSGDLYNKIIDIHKDSEISYKSENQFEILEITLNFAPSTSENELNEFINTTDRISKELSEITYYNGIIFTLSINNTEVAVVRSYASNNGVFYLKDFLIEDDNYKNK